MFTLICARIHGQVNNGEAGDLRRHRAHYDVTVMCVAIDNLFICLLPGGCYTGNYANVCI